MKHSQKVISAAIFVPLVWGFGAATAQTISIPSNASAPAPHQATGASPVSIGSKPADVSGSNLKPGETVSGATDRSPGGLFVGAYIEDADANPEDPTAGLLYLNLPEKEAPFSGLMNFTFVGCQSKSFGTVSGDKSLNGLKGQWDGRLDHTVQSGSYEGVYNRDEKYYEGSYKVSKGKQLVTVANCIRYFVGPHGRWLLLAPHQTYSSGKTYRALNLQGLKATWQTPPASQMGVLSIIDKKVATANQGAQSPTGNPHNAMVFSRILTPAQSSFQLPANVLKAGETYVVSVIFQDRKRVVYASNKEWVAPR